MANLLTAIRLLLILPTGLGIAMVWNLSPAVLLSFIVTAVITDYLDGKVARHYGTASPRGQLFDHTTDFLFVTCGLFGAAYADLLTPVLPVLIVIAFAQYVLDSHFFYHEKQLHMSTLGRWNGILYFVPIIMIALSRTSLFAPISGAMTVGIFVLGWVLVLSTTLSIIDRAMAPLHIQPSEK